MASTPKEVKPEKSVGEIAAPEAMESKEGEAKEQGTPEVQGKEQVQALGGLSAEILDAYSAKFATPRNALAQAHAFQNGITNAALNPHVLRETEYLYSDCIPEEGKPVTSQRSSGRCWIFAALNVVRVEMMEKHKLASFELSQNYLYFWDHFERCNFFLEAILETRDKPIDSRIVAHLLDCPVQDGGQYDMIINIVEKYGMVPKSAYDDTATSIATAQMNRYLKNKLRQFAMELRTLNEGKTDIAALRKRKEVQLEVIYRAMALLLGNPPTKFDWRFKNKSKKLVEFKGLTPQSFYRDHVPFKMSSMVSLVNDPRNEYYKLYTVEYLGNVQGGRPVLYVNVPIEELKKYVDQTISVTKKPVWFGCDFGNYINKKNGVMDMRVHDYELLMGEGGAIEQSKASRLHYHASLMTHAMVFTAVDKKEDVVVGYRVENSHSKDKGKEGYLHMSSEWFDEYVYQIAVDKSLLSEKVKAVLDQTPHLLPAWDPMGALAK